MLEEKLVSIIMPVYNSQNTIANAINSVLKQTYSHFELIIIDDGSTDSTSTICKEIKDERVIYVYKENEGVSIARNAGLKIATGEYICFIDSDDSYIENYIEKLCKNAENGDLIICGYIKQYKENKEFMQIHKGEYDSEIIMQEVLENDCIGGFLWNKLFKKKIISDKKLIFDHDINVGEDLLFVEKYLQYCKKVIIINEYIYVYNILSTSASHNFSYKTVTMLMAYLRMLECSESTRYKKLIINRYINQLLAFYGKYKIDGKILNNYYFQLKEKCEKNGLKISKMFIRTTLIYLFITK